MIKESNVVCLESPDCFLGSSQERYFGEGYRKTKHLLSDFQIRDKVLIAKLNINWTSLWSQKKGMAVSPHVGSLDFFLASMLLVEQYVRVIDNIKEVCIEDMWVSNFLCKAGSQCIQSTTIPCSCTKLSQKIENSTLIHVYKIKIDNVTTHLTIQQKQCENNSSECLSSCNGLASIILENINRAYELGKLSYYKTAYKIPDRNISNIIIDEGAHKIKADIDLLNWNYSGEFKGVGRKYLPCVTYCDLILITGQLSQILLYKLEGITREDADNLWLRSIDCQYKKAIGNRASVEVSVLSSEILCIASNHFRNVTLKFDFDEGNLIATCKAAYKVTDL